MLITELEPREVFQYFSQIASIPHGSGNTDAIADYCVEFANEHGLRAVRDEYNNVVIFADAASGYEDAAPVMLQGHLDMVCEKDESLDVDMEKEPVKLCTDGEKVWAKGTTLGGDDGIAVAYILALLAAKDIPHPAIEAILTSDEETGMYGARGLDMTGLKAEKLINIDSEEEGFLCVSCAGGVRACCRLPYEKRRVQDKTESYRISLGGLQGGHSGVEIHKRRENAFQVMGSLLSRLMLSCKLTLADITGGGKDNVIPKTAEAIVCIPKDEAALLKQEFMDYRELVLEELKLIEPNTVLKLEKTELPEFTMDEASTRRLVFALQFLPNGVERMNPEIDELVQCSSNLGIVNVHEEHITLRSLIRSNTASGKKLLYDKVTSFIEYLGGEVVTESDYPAWEYRQTSDLRRLMIHEYEAMYGKEPVVTAMHAGLECGLFAGKRPDLDMISIGPDLTDVHTPQETMDVKSVERTWEYLKRVLAAMK